MRRPDPIQPRTKAYSPGLRARRNVVQLFEPEERPAVELNPIDMHVGGRVRLQRIFRGLSLETLADALDVDVERLQGFEAGFERIDAYLLRDIVKILATPPSFFFEGFLPEAPQKPQER